MNPETEMRKHNTDVVCKICGDTYHLEEDMINPMEDSHKVDLLSCDACKFTTNYQEHLGKHIVEKHKVTNQNPASNQDADEQASNTKQSAKKVTVTQDYIEKILAENANFKEEVSILKGDFERLQDIFETRNSTSKTDTRETEVELADIREKFRVTKTENEFLREKNDNLFKLGRMAL